MNLNLSDKQLDWAVAVALGVNDPMAYVTIGNFHPTTDWAQTGSIIATYHISLSIKHDGWWLAQIYDINDDGHYLVCEHDPILAALKCFVLSKWTSELNPPTELL